MAQILPLKNDVARAGPEPPEKAHSLGIFAFCCITRCPAPKAWGPSTASLSPLPTDSPSSP
jgi:hypothetical protein